MNPVSDYKAIPNPHAIPAERRVYISAVPKLTQNWCGHKIDLSRFPRTNCERCWSYFFVANEKWTQRVANIYAQETEGRTTLLNEYGSKVVKKLERFFAAVNEIQKAQQLIKDSQAKILTDTEQPVEIDAIYSSLDQDLNTTDDVDDTTKGDNEHVSADAQN